ncbi:hypothetical protein [Candidatus Binatus sp.]|uniref:hypothetical protein n=1 Tax=Candidatus Binatus sp. TaxID=2811406 RepID=UPI003C50F5F6
MMKSAKLKATATMMLGAIVAAAPRIANACATCGLSEGDHAANAYRDSVLFMMASPYALFGTVGGVAYFVYRRSQRQDRNSTNK